MGHKEGVEETVPVVLLLREPENVPDSVGDALDERQGDAVTELEAVTVDEKDIEGEEETVGHAEGVRETLPELLPLRDPEKVPEWDGEELTLCVTEEVADTVDELLREYVGELVIEKDAKEDAVRLPQLVVVEEALPHRVGEKFADEDGKAVPEVLRNGVTVEDHEMVVHAETVGDALPHTVGEKVTVKVDESDGETEPLKEAVVTIVAETGLDGDTNALPVGCAFVGEEDAEAQVVPEEEIVDVLVADVVGVLETVRFPVCEDVVDAVEEEVPHPVPELLGVPVDEEVMELEEEDVSDEVLEPQDVKVEVELVVALPVPLAHAVAQVVPEEDTELVDLADVVTENVGKLVRDAVAVTDDVNVYKLVLEVVSEALLLPLVELEPVEDDVAVLRLVVLTVADVVAEED